MKDKFSESLVQRSGEGEIISPDFIGIPGPVYQATSDGANLTGENILDGTGGPNLNVKKDVEATKR